jgi:hypothetical protein
MNPQEIVDYKMKWAPGHSVELHTDVYYQGLDWCKERLKKHQYDVKKWTDVYYHEFRFETDGMQIRFLRDFARYTK